MADCELLFINLSVKRKRCLLTKTETSQMSNVRPLMFSKKKSAPET